MTITNPRSSLFPELHSFLTTEEIFDDVVKMKQVHGNHILVVTESGQEIGEADGMVTKIANVTLSVRTADCGNLYFYDPVAKVIGICHAGWRGTASGIVTNTITAMQVLGSEAKDIVVYAGPAICASCHQFTKETEGLFEDKYYEQGLLNLRSVWRDQLLVSGIDQKKIVISGICTMCQSDLPSFKRNRTEERIVGVISLLTK